MGAKKQLINRKLFQCYLAEFHYMLLKKLAGGKSMAQKVRELIEQEAERLGMSQ